MEFFNCSNLESVTIPDSVTSLGIGVFLGCNKLTDITYGGTPAQWEALSPVNANVPDDATIHYPCGDKLSFTLDYSTGTLTISGTGAIPDYNDSDNKAPWIGFLEKYNLSLKTVVIGDGATRIGNYAFYNCAELSSVAIPEGVTTIGENAFGDSGLTSVAIPEGVTTIGDSAFSDCLSLASVAIPEGVTRIGLNAFYYCQSLASVTLPEGVTTIGQYAFAYCLSLASATVPASVESIGEAAFGNCLALADITFGGTPKQWRALSADAGVPDGATIHYPNACGDDLLWSLEGGTLTITGTGEMYDYDFISNQAPWYGSREGITSVVIGDGVTTLGNCAFVSVQFDMREMYNV